ncbi:hypothetical protein K1T71_014679 [Dendrolimus kikuchii]|uniref:Uncharacterized protein n=1 Tax=Dendrolimus kikuchii TaxID=765133 RepID=A0ACC1CEQ3_9NEOP|nr:hypothetical protein K1T71_014679 [Dendrolimus kikuchii]
MWLFAETIVVTSSQSHFSTPPLNLPEGAECKYHNYKGTCVKYNKCMSPAQLLRHLNSIPVKCLEYLSTLPYESLTYTSIDKTLSELNCKIVSTYLTQGGGIAGGRAAERDRYPHMALLGYGNDLKSVQWLCGGSVISEKFVLTAAHCIFTKFGNVSYVAVGMLRRTDPPEIWQRIKVKRIIPYPEYKSSSKYHDIALLETEVQFKFSKAVLPACLDTAEPQPEPPFNILQVTGWGALDSKQSSLADTLQVVDLEEFSEEECSLDYPPKSSVLEYGYDKVIQICYGSRNNVNDTCKGDSGGPLQRSISLERQYQVVGVTSFGNRCGIKGGAAIYTRVEPYLQWIENIVWPLGDPKELEEFKKF